MKINVIKIFSGVFQCCWERLSVPFFFQQDTDMKFPGQFDKISWFLQPAGLEMLEKVSNSQPKALSIRNFSTSLSEHLTIFQPTRFFSGTGKVRNRFVRCPWVLSNMPKIPEISVRMQMERSVSVSSDRNIRDHLWRWSTYFGWNIPIEIRRSIFDKPVLCPN